SSSQGFRAEPSKQSKTSTGLERILVGQVVTCWMEVKDLRGPSAAPGRGSLELAGFRLKRLESAQRRYLTAIKTLTTERGLIPAGTAPPGTVKLYEEPGRQRA